MANGRQSIREQLECVWSGRHKVVCDSRDKDHSASDVPEGSHVEAQRQNNEETDNDVIFSQLDFRRGIKRWGSRAKQRRNESIEAVPRGPPQVLSPDQTSIGGGDGLIDSCGTRERPTDVRACFEREPPERLQRPPRRGWLRDLPAKGPLPQHGVYIGRSYGAFYQPQGWGNPFKPDPRKGKHGLQEVVDAYEQHLCQSRVLVDRLPELSGKVLYCHCKPTDPCHADALLRAWEQNVGGPVAPGVGCMLKNHSHVRLKKTSYLSSV